MTGMMARLAAQPHATRVAAVRAGEGPLPDTSPHVKRNVFFRFVSCPSYALRFNMQRRSRIGRWITGRTRRLVFGVLRSATARRARWIRLAC